LLAKPPTTLRVQHFPACSHDGESVTEKRISEV
jgi:hypothetical protein